MNELEALEKYPRRTIPEISKITGIPAIDLSQAQHEQMKRIIKRDSPLWGNDDEIIPEN